MAMDCIDKYFGLTGQLEILREEVVREVKQLREENARLKSQLAANGAASNPTEQKVRSQEVAIPAEHAAAPLRGIMGDHSHHGSSSHSPKLDDHNEGKPTRCHSAPMIDTSTAHIKEIKSAIKKRDEKPVYDVSQEYYDDGVFQAIARNARFEQITLLVVVLNGIWIAIDVDYNKGDGAMIWTVADNLFCVYFTAELVIRFLAFKIKRHSLFNAWFVFDLVLVLMMVFETWAMPLYSAISGTAQGGGGDAQVLRLLRLLRLSRMAKMMRSVPELMVLIKGTVVGIRSVAITLCLLGGITFVFAIAMRTLTDGSHLLSTSQFSCTSIMSEGSVARRQYAGRWK
jgi:hypothetical protein